MLSHCFVARNECLYKASYKEKVKQKQRYIMTGTRQARKSNEILIARHTAFYNTSYTQLDGRGIHMGDRRGRARPAFFDVITVPALDGMRNNKERGEKRETERLGRCSLEQRVCMQRRRIKRGARARGSHERAEEANYGASSPADLEGKEAAIYSVTHHVRRPFMHRRPALHRRPIGACVPAKIGQSP